MAALNPNPLLWDCPGSSGGTQVFSQGQEGGAGTEQLLSLPELLSWGQGQGMGSGTGWACVWQWLLSWHRWRAGADLSPNPRAIHTPADSSGHFITLVLLVLGG